MKRLAQPQALFGVAAVVLMIASAIAWIPCGNDNPLNAAVGQGLWSMLVGEFLLRAAYAQQDSHLSEPIRLALPWSDYGIVVVGVFLLVFVGEIIAHRFVPLVWSSLSHHVQFLIWFIGVVLIVGGMAGPHQTEQVRGLPSLELHSCRYFSISGGWGTKSVYHLMRCTPDLGWLNSGDRLWCNSSALS